ncbi:MAG: outer membrane protein [Hyphomicrobiaceae bacterium]|jgi:outer membrane immunogenic protein
MWRSVLGTASIAFLLSASAASADDFGRFSWTGIYAGLHGGYASTTIKTPDLPPYPAGPPDQDLKGGIVGGQIGAQYQLSNSSIVIGAEADVSFGNLDTTVRDGNYITEGGTISALGTVRARLGFAMGRFMPYVTGGLMWDRLKQSQECPDPAGVPFGWCRPANGYAPYNLSKTETNIGWTLGGGVDYAIADHWFVRLEGLYGDLGKESYGLGTTPSGKTLKPYDVEHQIGLARFALNYKF